MPSHSLLPNRARLLHLIEGVYEGEIVLPEFQRSFVWSNQDIRDLLVSILSGYFIGTFLFIRRGSSFEFGIRYFEGVRELRRDLPEAPQETMVERAVLDGQQRLTAVFYALHAPPGVSPKQAQYPYRYFLRIRDVVDRNVDWEDAVVHYSEGDPRAVIPWDGARKSFRELLRNSSGPSFHNLLQDPRFQKWCFQEGLLPFPMLADRDKFDQWLLEYKKFLRKQERWDEDRADRWRNSAEARMRDWFDFEVPFIQLENYSVADVAEIFERINRTGVVLSVFALATAVFYRQGLNLRYLWRESYENSEILPRYCDIDDEDFPKMILQVMALLQGKEVKKRVLINPREFRVNKQKWAEACSLLEKALQRLENAQTGYGVIRPDLIPSTTSLIVLAALLKECRTNKDFRKVDAWYWSAMVTDRYTHSSDTAVKQDYDALRTWLKNDRKVPQLISTARARLDAEIDLRQVSKGTLYRAIIGLIALNGAKDFFTGQSIELSLLDDHHIFPKGCGLSLHDENSILNRTLINSDTNRRKIHKRRPSVYVKEMIKDLGKGRVREILRSHLIDEEGMEALLRDDYDAFLECRERVIKEELRRRIGDW